MLLGRPISPFRAQVLVVWLVPSRGLDTLTTLGTAPPRLSDLLKSDLAEALLPHVLSILCQELDSWWVMVGGSGQDPLGILLPVERLRAGSGHHKKRTAAKTEGRGNRPRTNTAAPGHGERETK